MNADNRKRDRDTKRFSTPAGLSSLLNSGVSHQIGKASDRGKVRQSNEDCISTIEFTYIFKSISFPMGLYIISDGMGGLAKGDIASRIAVSTISNEICNKLFQSGWIGSDVVTSHEDFQQMIENAVYIANEEICQYGLQFNKEMGATVTVALVMNRNAYIMNVGDSRTYLFNKNEGLHLITQDHSLVFRLYLMGHLQLKEVYKHPQKSQILRALGESRLKENLEEMANSEKHPFFYTQELSIGDHLLLCSDGLWQMIHDSQIEQVLREHPEPQSACDRLVSLANENGGEDNISVTILKIG